MRVWPSRFSARALRDDMPMGAGGLELDSVEIAELLLECEDCTGRAPSDDLFTDGALTIGHVAAHFGLQ